VSTAQSLWDSAWLKEAEGVDLTFARVGGRTSKVFPNRENVDFWQQTGPEWVQSYINWRIANTDWKIWYTPEGAPAIELGLTPIFAGVPVKMVLDRVFEVNGELVVVDLKTSQQTPTNTLQLGFYKLGLKQIFGIDIKYGTYWMARQEGTSSMVDLSSYTDEKLEYLIAS